MQEIKNVYVDVYCIRDGMVHIFFCGKYLESDGGITFGFYRIVIGKFLRGVEVGRGMEME